MRAFFIGHRGSGKSSFLRQLFHWYPEVPHFDLDQVISEGEGQSISDIFLTQGEASFRNLEKKYFEKLMATFPAPTPLFLAVGAGFDVTLLEKKNTYWIGRRSDFLGRVFVDRPLLSQNLSHANEALQDFQKRLQERTKLYASIAEKRILWRLEGLGSLNDKALFGKKYSLQDASLTLTPDILKQDLVSRETYFKELASLGLSYLEIRNDLFLAPEIKTLLSELETKNLKVLVSIRKLTNLPDLSQMKVLMDWDQDLGPIPSQIKEQIHILSSHSAQEPQILSQDTCPNLQHLKWAPVIHSWKELDHGFQWQKADPMRRSFLPRSPDPLKEAQFTWARLVLKGKQKINFVKERSYLSEEEVLLKNADQPVISEWISWNPTFQNFAALLGDPALHSWTPSFHQDFFSSREMNITAIPVAKDALGEALFFLKKLGLRAAAVTSPHKKTLFELADVRDPSTFRFEAANTLIFTNHSQLKVWNTDLAGAEFLMRGLEGFSCAVVGGGGTADVLKAVLPQASFYSARSLELKSGIERGHYDLVVWAAGGRVEDLHLPPLPPSCLQPRALIDLDYRENSAGRAVALYLKKLLGLKNLKYIPGHKMFFKQAKAQQEKWHEVLGGP